MPELSRKFFQISSLELAAALVYLAVSMFSTDGTFILGYTLPRFSLLLVLGVVTFLFLIPGFLLSSDRFQKLENRLLEKMKTPAAHFAAIMILIAGLSATALFIIQICGISITSNRFNILWLCLGLVSLQTSLLIAVNRQSKPAQSIYQTLTHVTENFNKLNMLGLSRVEGIDYKTRILRQIWVSLCQLVILTLAYLVYGQVISHPSPESILFRYGFTGILLMSFIVLLFTYSLTGWSGKFLALASTLVLFGLPLAGLWSGAFNESSVFRGLLPWSDANSYLIDANRLLDGGLFMDKSARRPLFAGLFAVLLGITQYNQQAAMMLLVAINAVSCYLAGREVQRTHGSIPGTIFVLLLFLFYRRYTGTTLTENLGFALGTLGFALLWRGALEKHKGVIFLGIFITTLALNARAGAYLVLPFLVIWAAWLFRGRQWLSKNTFFLGLAAVGCSFFLNMLVYQTVSVEQSSPEANFSNVLYGLVTGGQVWDQVYQDYPEIEPLSEPLHSQTIYRYAIQAFQDHPQKTLQGVLKGWSYFFHFDRGLFNFIRSAYFDSNYLFCRYAIYLLSILGIVRGLSKQRDEWSYLILMAFLGTILSVPFVPLWDAAYMRLYASTIPFIAALPLTGLIWLVEIISRRGIPLFKRQISDLVIRPETTASFTLLLASVTILGPFLIKMTASKPVISQPECPAHQTPVIMRVSQGSYLNIVDDESISDTWVPDIRHSNFTGGNNYDFPDTQFLNTISGIQPSMSMINNYDMLEGSIIRLVVESKMLSEEDAIMRFCGEWNETGELFFARSAKIVTQE